MDYITIATPENIEIEYRLASLGSRLAAAFIDILIQSAALFVVGAAVLFGVMGFDIYRLDKLDIYGAGPAMLAISFFIIYFGYYIGFEFAMNGQTPGKKLLKLRVIRNNGQPISLGHSITRNILRYFVDANGAGIVCMFLNHQHKRVGDMAASTIVIAENPNVNIIRLNSAFEYKGSQMAARLTDEEYYLLVDFLGRRHLFGDYGSHLRQRIARYFAWKLQAHEYTITDEALVQLAEANRR